MWSLTHHVSDDVETLLARGRPLARDHALHADFLRSADDLPLLGDNTTVHGADEDVNTLEVFLQLRVVIRQVSDTDLDSRGLPIRDDGLRY